MDDTVNQINRDILALWKQRFPIQAPDIYCPMICPKPTADGLVVVGCNPALPTANYYAVPVFQPDPPDSSLAALIQLETDARKSYPYYLPFHRIARQLGLPWEHIDLFFFRETSQSKLKQMVMDADGTLNDFGLQQVVMAARLLQLARPRIILVANAFAARVFKAQFGLGSLDDEGLYWTELGARKVPTFLSSMLSGARPLDNHSLERLLWHMQKTLKTLHSAGNRS